MSAPGERIVAQGVEYIGAKTRRWSRWDSGAVTWAETVTVWSMNRAGMWYASICYVSTGSGGGPPEHVKMTETAPIDRAIRAALGL